MNGEDKAEKEAAKYAERMARLDKLCLILETTRQYIADPILTMVMGEPSIDPTRLEEWLARHGKRVKEGESIYDALCHHYGRETADLAASLV